MIKNARQLVNWRINNHFPDIEKIVLDIGIFYKHDNILFKMTPFCIYLVTNKKLTSNNFINETLLVYRDNRYVEKGNWEEYINGYLSNIKKSQTIFYDNQLREEKNRLAKERKEHDIKLKQFEKIVAEKL